MITTYIGSHISNVNLIKSTEAIKNKGGNIVQIFLSSPRNTMGIKKTEKELIEFKEYLEKNKMKVVVHSSYLHNIAREWDEYSWWILSIIDELKYCKIINAIGLVIHFGKQLDLTLQEAYNNMYTCLVYICQKTKDYNVQIFLETSTGQGSETCYRLEELAHFFNKFIKCHLKDRIKLCIDTCHIFAAGYDIRTPHGVKMYLEAFDEMIGLKYVGLVHMNDSKVKLGAQVDRHDNIGKGYIGLKGLKYFCDFMKKLGIPIVLETPENGYVSEIKLLTMSH